MSLSHHLLGIAQDFDRTIAQSNAVELESLDKLLSSSAMDALGCGYIASSDNTSTCCHSLTDNLQLLDLLINVSGYTYEAKYAQPAGQIIDALIHLHVRDGLLFEQTEFPCSYMTFDHEQLLDLLGEDLFKTFEAVHFKEPIGDEAERPVFARSIPEASDYLGQYIKQTHYAYEQARQTLVYRFFGLEHKLYGQSLFSSSLCSLVLLKAAGRFNRPDLIDLTFVKSLTDVEPDLLTERDKLAYIAALYEALRYQWRQTLFKQLMRLLESIPMPSIMALTNESSYLSYLLSKSILSSLLLTNQIDKAHQVIQSNALNHLSKLQLKILLNDQPTARNQQQQNNAEYSPVNDCLVVTKDPSFRSLHKIDDTSQEYLIQLPDPS